MSPIRRTALTSAHVLALLIAAAPAVRAQIGDYDPALTFPGISHLTLEHVHAAAAKLFEGHPVGATEPWSSPDQPLSGQAKLLNVFDSSNMPCRTIEYSLSIQGTMSAKYPGRYVLTWCRVPDGVWKIVEVPPPR